MSAAPSLQPAVPLADAAGLAWDEAWATGQAGMDALHHEFVERVDAMLGARDADLGVALEAFAEHAVRHFGDEDRQMKQGAYPAGGCHVEEHERVLASLAEVRVALAAGRMAVVRRFARALADWFPEHAAMMDQALAQWLAERQWGGAPVAIRRRPAPAAAAAAAAIAGAATGAP